MMSDMSAQMQDMRAEMMKDERTSLMMDALRGKNINDDDKQVADIDMLLVETRASEDLNDILPTVYSADALAAYFGKRPGAVLQRVVQIMATSSGFLGSVVRDYLVAELTGMDEDTRADQEVARAVSLRRTIVSLGPFFIKLGQALSIRPDILSPRAMVELQQLCDKVPSFPSPMAMRTIEEELCDVATAMMSGSGSESTRGEAAAAAAAAAAGVAQAQSASTASTSAGGGVVNTIFSDISPEPVAAASLGQVYKATLRATGETVAVKVQRPFVLETVSLDLFLVRSLGQFTRTFLPGLSKRLDLVSLLDEFANNFYQELDYNLECANGVRIAEDMKMLPLVKIPRNYPAYTARRVHVAEWVDGEKLSQSTADDVGSLVNLGVITYLTQLLETGFFHADPHPGNMMRTPDGQLVILDFGLMTKITDDQKFGMIEAIAHLIHRDYEKIGEDFVNLDFIPRDVDTTPIIPALARVFDAALAGGGAKSINFQELASDLAEITFKFPFQIPPYFALVIRAISVLEGIALVGNPEFAIVDEAYPFISKRLMTSPHPRLKAAFRYMVYGKNGKSIDIDRVLDMLTALEKFIAVKERADGSAFKVDGVRGGREVGRAGDARGTRSVADVKYSGTGTNAIAAAASSGSHGHGHEKGGGAIPAISTSAPTAVPAALPSSPAEEQAVREALRFFFSEEGVLFRDIVVDEVTSSIDALSRDAARELVVQLVSIVPQAFINIAGGSGSGSGSHYPPNGGIGGYNYPPGGGSGSGSGSGSSKRLRGLRVPSLLKVLAPKLDREDRKTVDSTIRLVRFFAGLEDDDRNGSNGGISAASLGAFVTKADNRRKVAAVLPLVREYEGSIRSFGAIIVSKLVDRVAGRVLDATSRAIFRQEPSMI
jgi:aarF domain-containing kinase